MVFTLFLACYTFAFVTPLRGYVRALILLASPVVAVTCNVIRLVPTVWVFGHASPQTAHRFHDISGWVMLILAFVGLTGMIRVLKWASLPVAPATSQRRPPPPQRGEAPAELIPQARGWT